MPVSAKKTEWPKDTLTSAVSPDVYPEDFAVVANETDHYRD